MRDWWRRMPARIGSSKATVAAPAQMSDGLRPDGTSDDELLASLKAGVDIVKTRGIRDPKIILDCAMYMLRVNRDLRITNLTKENHMTDEVVVPPVPPVPPVTQIATATEPTLMQSLQSKLMAARVEAERAAGVIATLEAEIASIPEHLHNLTPTQLRDAAEMVESRIAKWF